MKKPRARELGLDINGLTGTHNAITDVPGVLVGYTTRIEGSGPLQTGNGPIRTGVTAILPRGRDTDPKPVWAGLSALNGNGEMTGSHWIRDGGYFVGPLCITNTHSVGIVHHAATRWMINHYRHGHAWEDNHLWAMPVVAETYDGVLNDINGQHITEADALLAINAASDGPIDEGNVGGGTGMVCYEFKGGTGTSSRKISVDGKTYTLGVLVQANHGIRPWFTPLGVPVGKLMTDNRLVVMADGGESPERGSIIVIIGTDAPVLPHQLERIARRASIGIGLGGTPGGNSSGDIFLAFSVANEQPLMQFATPHLNMQVLNDSVFDDLYRGTVDATEEAVLNALLAAQDMTSLRPGGFECKALNHSRLVEIMRNAGRCLPE